MLIKAVIFALKLTVAKGSGYQTIVFRLPVVWNFKIVAKDDISLALFTINLFVADASHRYSPVDLASQWNRCL